MIHYKDDEEKQVALFFAKELNDPLAYELLNKGKVANAEQATHLARFFWRMVDKSAEGKVQLPSGDSSEYWCEQLLHSLHGYMDAAGYLQEWDIETDRA